MAVLPSHAPFTWHVTTAPYSSMRDSASHKRRIFGTFVGLAPIRWDRDAPVLDRGYANF